jgi:ribosomal protein L15E
MSDNKKIKIVKKVDAAALKSKPARADNRARRKAREVVSTVSDWVTDLRARKSEETKAAIDSLFAGGPRPSES